MEGFKLIIRPQILHPRYNIAPSQPAAVITPSPQGGRALDFMVWGLIPSWVKDLSRSHAPINARSETVATKPSFRAAFRHRRCLVPADGFYEWGLADGRKRPHHFKRRDGAPFALAGIWENWMDASGTEIHSFAILTTEPNPLVSPIHHRMPVILPPSSHERWLAPDPLESAEAGELFLPFPAQEMTAHAVSDHVNNPAHDDPLCIAPVP